MSTFVQAMNAPDATKHGVNGSLVYTDDGVDDSRVVLFTSSVRGTEPEFLRKHLQQIVQSNPLDAWLLVFQARDVRGGKGERQLFYDMFEVMAKLRSEPECIVMLRLIPEYGSWLDLMHMFAVGDVGLIISNLIPPANCVSQDTIVVIL